MGKREFSRMIDILTFIATEESPAESSRSEVLFYHMTCFCSSAQWSSNPLHCLAPKGRSFWEILRQGAQAGIWWLYGPNPGLWSMKPAPSEVKRLNTLTVKKIPAFLLLSIPPSSLSLTPFLPFFLPSRIFTEHLLWARHCAKEWKDISEQKKSPYS